MIVPETAFRVVFLVVHDQMDSPFLSMLSRETAIFQSKNTNVESRQKRQKNRENLSLGHFSAVDWWGKRVPGRCADFRSNSDYFKGLYPTTTAPLAIGQARPLLAAWVSGANAEYWPKKDTTIQFRLMYPGILIGNGALAKAAGQRRRVAFRFNLARYS